MVQLASVAIYRSGTEWLQPHRKICPAMVDRIHVQRNQKPLRLEKRLGTIPSDSCPLDHDSESGQLPSPFAGPPSRSRCRSSALPNPMEAKQTRNRRMGDLVHCSIFSQFKRPSSVEPKIQKIRTPYSRVDEKAQAGCLIPHLLKHSGIMYHPVSRAEMDSFAPKTNSR